MRKDLGKHFLYAFLLTILIVVVNRLFSLTYWPVLVGVVLGTLLPDVDHLIYSFFLRPQDLSSQRVESLARQGQIGRMTEIMYQTKGERVGLIFHSVLFQLVFGVLAFLVVTSSGSVFGGGLVLAVLLHLLIDEWLDYKARGSISSWFNRLNFVLTESQQKNYMGLQFALLLILTLLL